MYYFRHFSDLFCKLLKENLQFDAIYALGALFYLICAGKYKQGPRNHQKCKEMQRQTRLSELTSLKQESSRESQGNSLPTGHNEFTRKRQLA